MKAFVDKTFEMRKMLQKDINALGLTDTILILLFYLKFYLNAAHQFD